PRIRRRRASRPRSRPARSAPRRPWPASPAPRRRRRTARTELMMTTPPSGGFVGFESRSTPIRRTITVPMARKSILLISVILLSAASLFSAVPPRQRPARIGGTAARALTSVAIVADQTSIRYGEAFEFTVTVTPQAPATGQPTGVVWFMGDAGSG